MPATPAENALTAAYELAQQELKQQPEDDRGAVIVLGIIGEDMKCHAYGSPEMWAKMLAGVAERNDQFKLAMQVASLAIQHGVSLD